MEYLKLKAYAKVNLVLEVMGKLEDGYHEIKTIFQTVNLFDDITVQGSTDVRVTFINGEGIDTQNNLVIKAVKLIQAEMGCNDGAHITVTKRIPVGSGLGGGSADAAATLNALNLIWDLRLTKTRLMKMASVIGADVPFFLEGGLAVGTGKGDSVRVLSNQHQVFFVLLDIPHSLTEKTKFLYESLDPSLYTTGLKVNSFIREHEKGIFSLDSIYNVFTQLAELYFPDFEYYQKTLYGLGCKHVSLSGTGPVLFALFQTKEAAEHVCDSLLQKGIKAHCVQSVSSENVNNG
tara:strand:- start:818 stop:1690 length:873 start_codon:yes stop_codon:yes gene_type:complete